MTGYILFDSVYQVRYLVYRDIVEYEDKSVILSGHKPTILIFVERSLSKGWMLKKILLGAVRVQFYPNPFLIEYLVVSFVCFIQAEALIIIVYKSTKRIIRDIHNL